MNYLSKSLNKDFALIDLIKSVYKLHVHCAHCSDLIKLTSKPVLLHGSAWEPPEFNHCRQWQMFEISAEA